MGARRCSADTTMFHRFFTAIIIAVGANLAIAASGGAGDAELEIIDSSSASDVGVDLDRYLWTHRLIAVFSDSPESPLFLQQMELLRALPEELIERDVIVLTDTDPTIQSSLRMQLRPRGFTIVIIGKDGGVKLRKPFPWSIREISRAIDKMPLRQLELQSK